MKFPAPHLTRFAHPSDFASRSVMILLSLTLPNWEKNSLSSKSVIYSRSDDKRKQEKEGESEKESEVKERESWEDQAIGLPHCHDTPLPQFVGRKKAELFNLSCSVALIPSSAGTDRLTVYDTPPTKIRLGIKTP